ncbi:MAG: type I restriction enzyme HsdR N-terminal domain-containing protein [Bacteroidales bacterium]|nr:type I restriction enzyme HsdR N-terminal domain-containing protein [Bacteroidales bacterium]MBN2697347.1 type I restriction enzyme HsdR N-terminal domain-containing protein [Bacteroidales bacterium]
MQKLNLPRYDFKFSDEGGRRTIFDPFRKKYVLLTPEEWVRQSFVRYLTEEKDYPASLIMTEQALHLNRMIKRCDVIVHKPAGNPVLLIECKAPGVQITGDSFDQVSRYNIVFRVKYLMVTNGLKHYCCRVDFESRQLEFLNDLPCYGELD